MNTNIPVILQSSQDPNAISMRIKALLVAIIPMGLIVATQLGYTFSQEQAMEIATVITAIISLVMYLYGHIRSIKPNDNL
jgi:uncharacterized membrane protein